MNSNFSPFISFHMVDFSISCIAFLDLVFLNAGLVLIAVFITEMVILHKYVFIFFYVVNYWDRRGLHLQSNVIIVTFR